MDWSLNSVAMLLWSKLIIIMYWCDPQSSSSCTSEDGDLDGNAKSGSKKTGTRASRGAATDPQSLYARVSTQHTTSQSATKQMIKVAWWMKGLFLNSNGCKLISILQKRRERINERLKTLQNLVPNGTKVGSCLGCIGLQGPIICTYISWYYKLRSNLD